MRTTFADQYNASWLCQRHRYKTPNQIRAEQKGLEPQGATGGQDGGMISATLGLITVPRYNWRVSFPKERRGRR